MTIKKFLAITFLVVFVALPIAVTAEDFGLSKAANKTKLIQSNNDPDAFFKLIGKVVGAGLSLIGIIFFVLILYAGIRWMLAMGKNEDVENSKNIIEGAVIGLVIVLAAYAITSFVIGSLLGSSPEPGPGAVCGAITESSNCQPPYCEWDNTTNCTCVLDQTGPPYTDCNAITESQVCQDDTACSWECFGTCKTL